MMHSPLPDAMPRSRYRTRRGIDPAASLLTIAIIAVLLGAASTYRVVFEPAWAQPSLIVQTFDLSQPAPPPPSKPVPPVPVTAIHAPIPAITLPVPQPTSDLITTPDLPATKPSPSVAEPAVPTPPATPGPLVPARPHSAGDLSSSMIHAPPPRYPRESRRMREQGTVVLRLLLHLDGTVADIRIARSSGYSRLDEAARNAVQKWRWSPTVRDGIAVQVSGVVEIPFVLTS